MVSVEFARSVAFVLRCSGAAVLSSLLAHGVGLPHAVWAAISGIVVCQEKLAETQSATVGRVFGTLVGIAIAVVVGSVLRPFSAAVETQMGLAVAVSAVVAKRYALLRVCMWTCPIVFLSADPWTPLYIIGFHRGAEVLVGALVGIALHGISDVAIRKLVNDEERTGGRSKPGRKC
jgi:uncharacterized membrane protein YccC